MALAEVPAWPSSACTPAWNVVALAPLPQVLAADAELGGQFGLGEAVLVVGNEPDEVILQGNVVSGIVVVQGRDAVRHGGVMQPAGVNGE